MNTAPPFGRFAARDLAAVEFDQVLDDGEAEAGAAGILAAAGARLVDAIEALEDPLRSASGMPGPSSVTVMTIRSSSRRDASTIVPPSGE